MRSFIIDDKEKEHTTMFGPENWLVTDVSLMSGNKEATLYIEALEDSEVDIINQVVFENIAKLPKDIFAALVP